MRRSLYFMIFSGILFLFGSLLQAEDVQVDPVIKDKIAWFDTSKWAPEGQGWKEGLERYYARLPQRAKEKVTKNVWGLSQHSAGLFFRFRTDADRILVQYKLLGANLAMSHMPATGVSGLDLYSLYEGKWLWAGNTKPKKQEDQETIVSGMKNTMKDFILYLPLYNGIDRLEIGVPETAKFFAIAPVKEKSIVYYGSSIAHGGCASRPGNAYTAMLGRRLGLPVINLGFSGSAKMEPELAKIFAELDPAVFVLDPIPNMSEEMVKERAIPFIQILREHHPDTPILLVEDRINSNAWIKSNQFAGHYAKQKWYKKAYDHFKALGDKNIYYLPHDNLLGDQLDWDGTVDSSHPNDLGMYRMTDELERVLRPILKK